MKDRFMIGIISGSIAGIMKDLPGLFFYYVIKITDKTLWDYAGTIVMARLPSNLPEEIFAFVVEVFFSTFLGVLYAYLSLKIKTEHYLLKGALYGSLIWFIVKTGILAFHITPLYYKSISSGISNWLLSVFYGLLLAAFQRYLENRV